MENICPVCGRSVEAGNTFCPYCGATIDARNAWTPAPSMDSAQSSGGGAYTPPNATGGAAYPPPYAPVYPMPTQGKTGTGLGWITFVRVMLWIFFGLMEIATLYAAIGVFGLSGGHGLEILSGFLILLGGTLIAFLTVAGGMVALNNATNLRRIAINTAKTLELLERRK